MTRSVGATLKVHIGEVGKLIFGELDRLPDGRHLKPGWQRNA